jgi:Uma2 family endonuclease
MDEISEYNEVSKMPSTNHSYVQTQITLALAENKGFTPFVELSLDASQIDLTQFGLKTKDELVPDICLYEGIHQFEPRKDTAKRSDMPVLVVEVLSPTQGINDIINKFEACFALGIQSCWLVVPTTEVITVYSAQHFESFGTQDSEIIDKVLNIRLPTQKIWGTI